jgi:hypothetical protein
MCKCEFSSSSRIPSSISTFDVSCASAVRARMILMPVELKHAQVSHLYARNMCVCTVHESLVLIPHRCALLCIGVPSAPLIVSCSRSLPASSWSSLRAALPAVPTMLSTPSSPLLSHSRAKKRRPRRIESSRRRPAIYASRMHARRGAPQSRQQRHEFRISHRRLAGQRACSA